MSETKNEDKETVATMVTDRELTDIKKEKSRVMARNIAIIMIILSAILFVVFSAV